MITSKFYNKWLFRNDEGLFIFVSTSSQINFSKSGLLFQLSKLIKSRFLILVLWRWSYEIDRNVRIFISVSYPSLEELFLLHIYTMRLHQFRHESLYRHHMFKNLIVSKMINILLTKISFDTGFKTIFDLISTQYTVLGSIYCTVYVQAVRYAIRHTWMGACIRIY